MTGMIVFMSCAMTVIGYVVGFLRGVAIADRDHDIEAWRVATYQKPPEQPKPFGGAR
jgi:hypothetical protein